ncbi:P-loop NTPase fold protein [Prevotella melaninogenica]|uniref:P-loop NTPase fold protein n=1 Tax=Prevotella melaninogenica TaxID=28132 RepID=UPI00242DC885|nr:P-loop NTPase fold protein [Prevotella melaninogenica]
MKITLDSINISGKLNDFSQYLETTDRIILSAKFGDGKTYLLNELRKDEAIQDKYEFFTIYPVNYSVAKNEDVFEYIKRDIIVQLYERKLLDNIDLNALFGSVFTFDDLTSVVSFLLSFVPMGKFYNKVYNKFLEIKKKYDEKKHTADKYLSQFANTAGCIYEEDGYTKLIRIAIEWISQDHSLNGEERKAKKPVLIIEDLDRLDPKHLFRILNVVSAHIDDSKQPDIVGNKFGFNNIVLVMDYDVTKHIFHHFYGAQACYEGYMSKFLSREPFRYSIGPIMIQAFETQLGEKLGIQNLWIFFSRFRERLAESSLRDLHKLIQFETKFCIKQDEYIYSGGSMSTSLPLFHLIIYMMESGMSTEAIQADLLSLFEGGFQYSNEIEIEFIRLMYPVYILHFPNVKYIRGRKMVYFLEIEKKVDCSEVHVGLSGSWVEDSSLPLNLEKFDKVVMRFLKTLSDSMNLSALRLD